MSHVLMMYYVTVFLPWICIQLVATPYQRGFFCDDESISHPYKDSTITTEVLTVVGLALPIISVSSLVSGVNYI